MNFEEQAKRLLSNLQKVISEAEQLRPQSLTIDLDSKMGYELCLPVATKALQDAYVAQSNSKSGIVDVTSTTANIFGCEPCPECKSPFRVILIDNPKFIVCEDCGDEERIVMRKKI